MIKKISCNGSIHYKTTFIKTIKENFSIHNKVRKSQPFKISQFSGDWEAIKIYFLFFYIYQDLSILCKYLFIYATNKFLYASKVSMSIIIRWPNVNFTVTTSTKINSKYFCLFLCLRQEFSVQPCLFWNLLCR